MQISNWHFLCLCLVKTYSEGPGNEATVMNGVLVLAEVGGEGSWKRRICGQCPYTLLIMKIQLHKVTRVYASVCFYEKDKESVTLCSLVCCFVMLFSFIGLE